MTPAASSEHFAVSAEEVRRPGEVVAGRFRVGALIGAGAMGAVYEAEHLAIQRPVAIKFLRASFASNEAMRTRFRLEARAAGSLQSEHVTSVIDFGFADDGAPFIVLELLQGESLARRLRRGAVPPALAVEWMIQASRGVAAAHRAKVIHRDLKPANIFLCERAEGRELVKVLDFGVAKFVEGAEGAPDLTGSGLNPGTPLYMAPEQARGARDVDARADVFALGLILYEILSGRRARGGQSYNEVVYRILHQAPTPLHRLCPHLPAALIGVVEKAMAFEVADRFQTARALVEALTPLLPQLDGAIPPPALDAATTLGTTSAPTHTAPTGRWGLPTSRAMWLWALPLVGAVGGGLALVLSALHAPQASSVPVSALIPERAATSRSQEKPAAPSPPAAPHMEASSAPPAPPVAAEPSSARPLRRRGSRVSTQAETPAPPGTTAAPAKAIRQLPLEAENPYDP